MRRQRSLHSGSVVLVALCFVAVLGIAIGGYLMLSTQAMKLSNRTFQTILSEHLAEMGLECGVAAMNSHSWVSWTSADGTTATWSISGNTATALVTLPNGKYGDIGVTGLINVRINNYNVATNAVPWDSAANYTNGSTVSYNGLWYHCITGYMAIPTPPPASTLPPPVSPFWGLSPAPVVHAEGVVTLPDGSNPIRTQLVATLSYVTLFTNALAASSNVTVGTGAVVDSFDSSHGIYGQTTGTFNDGQTTGTFTALNPNIGYSAVLAGGSTGSYGVTLVGAVTVNGYVAAPSTTLAPLTPNWSYDIANSVLKGGPVIPSPKVDLTRVSRSPYIPQPSTRPVNSTSFPGYPSLPLVDTDISIGVPGDTVPTIYYAAGALDFGLRSTLTINGPVIIDVQGALSFSSAIGTGHLIIAPTGSAEIHFSGLVTCVDSTTGPLDVPSSTLYQGIDNQTLDPRKLVLIGTGGLNGHSFASNFDFYGAFYLPGGTITWNSGNLFGAISAQTINFNSGNLHYDVALRKFTVPGVDTPYVISKWREVIGPTDPDRVNF